MTRKLLAVCLLTFFSLSSGLFGETLSSYLTQGSTGTENSAGQIDGVAPGSLMPKFGEENNSAWRYTYHAVYNADAPGPDKISYVNELGLAPVEIFSMKLDRQEGYQVDLETLSFGVNHSIIQESVPINLSGGERAMGELKVPSIKFDLYASVDGGARQLITSQTPSPVSTYYFSDARNYFVSFDVSSLVSFNTVEFFVECSFLNDNTSTGGYVGTLDLSEVMLTGNVSIPEPAGFLFGGTGILALLLRRRRA